MLPALCWLVAHAVSWLTHSACIPPAQAAAESAYAPAAIAATTPVGQRTNWGDRPRQMKRKGSSPKQQSASKQVCRQSVTGDM
jgi:hypothetical protein